LSSLKIIKVEVVTNVDERISGLRDSLVCLDSEKVKENVSSALRKGIEPLKIVDSLADGMRMVGERYEAGEFFLPELMMAGEIMKGAMAIITPFLRRSERVQRMGKVVLGTVEGDLHDIGKNIVKTMLTSAGFEVVDLGADVSAKRFVESVRKEQPKIVGMSALLTSTMDGMKEVVDELKREGLRKGLKILIGGAPIEEDFARRIGADAYGKDAMDAVRKAKDLVGGES